MLTPGIALGIGFGGLIGMPRTDGITDQYSTIQGVRTYDPQLGSWTSPDAYAGTVSDPMSQQSYMYNNNNPVSYSDPSGFTVDYIDPALAKYITWMRDLSTIFDVAFGIVNESDKIHLRIVIGSKKQFKGSKAIGYIKPLTTKGGQWDGKSFVIVVKPGISFTHVIEDMAHELAGHAVDFVRKGSDKYLKDATKTNSPDCENIKTGCNQEERPFQFAGKMFTAVQSRCGRISCCVFWCKRCRNDVVEIPITS